MFPRKERYSFSKGMPKKVISSSFFTLRFRESDSLHVSVVIGKKVEQKATKRNRIKRLFTHELQEILKEKNIPYDMVFFLRKNIVDQIDLIQHGILDAFKKANIPL